MSDWDFFFRSLTVIVGIIVFIFNKRLSKEMETIKSTLQKGALIHRLQFEKEFESYVDIWKKLIEVRRATLSLRPISEFADPSVPEEERKKQKIEIFNKCYGEFLNAVDYNQPFFPKDIFEKLDALVRITMKEGSAYSFFDGNKKDYFEEGEKNRDVILNLINESCEAIRKRIALLEEA